MKKTLELFARLVLLFAVPAIAQDTPKTIALTDKSTIPPEDISKVLRKECPNVSIISDVTKSDYMLEATRKTDPKAGQDSFDFNLIDRDGKTFRSASNSSIGDAVKDVCHNIFVATGGQRTALPAPSKKGKTAVMVEVVDTQNLTLSADARGSGGIVPALTGRRTHTDNTTIHVIINGERALLDCYEHRKGCSTISPGKYYGELDGESVWVNYEMPLTHRTVRNHYTVAGGW